MAPDRSCSQSCPKEPTLAAGKVPDAKAPAFRRLAIDTSLQAGTASYFAAKLRAAVAYAFYRRTGDRAAIRTAVKHYTASRDAWAKLSTTATGVYVEDVTFGPNSALRGHWADRLEAINKDLAEMEAKSKEKPAAPDDSAPAWGEAISRPGFTAVPRQSRARCQHLPPATFASGKPIPVEIAVEAGYKLASATLHYRHVDQSDEYCVVEMSGSGRRFSGVIPGEYTDSAYPILYYFVLRDAKGDAWIHPGLNADLANQLYFIVRRT